MSRHPPRRPAALSGAVLTAVLLAAGCAGGRVAPDPGGDTRYVQPTAPGARYLPPADRKAAPKLTGTTLTGGPVELAALRGSVVVLNIWASWCAPCLAEQPELNRVAADTAGAGVRFLGINIKDSRANAVSYTRNRAVRYPSLYDDDGSTAARLPIAPTLPSTLVVDRAGRIAATFSGGVLAGELRPVVERVAAEPA
jgi:thiol-disulfide isomerase/thioredoxin